MTSVCVFLVAESMKKDLQIADDLTVFNSRPGLYAIDCQRMHGGSRNYEQRGGNAWTEALSSDNEVSDRNLRTHR